MARLHDAATGDAGTPSCAPAGSPAAERPRVPLPVQTRVNEAQRAVYGTIHQVHTRQDLARHANPPTSPLRGANLGLASSGNPIPEELDPLGRPWRLAAASWRHPPAVDPAQDVLGMG